MMIVTDKQLEAFRQIEEEKFIAQTLDFVKENCRVWTKDKKEEELKRYVDKQIQLFQFHDIKSKANIQDLIFANIIYNKGGKLTNKELDKLHEEKTNEIRRARNLIIYLKKENLKS